MSLIAWSRDEAHLALAVDLTLYSTAAILRAAYKMTDRVFVWLQRDSEIEDRLWVLFFGRTESADVKALTLEFFNELADQELRLRLEQEFSSVRTLIVAQAFAEGNLLPDGDNEGNRNSAGKAR